jgi:4-oxalocrotonate tautomerase
MPFVQVTMVRGRTIEQKHALIAAVSQAVASSLDTPVERVRVAIYEVGPDEWGIGGQPYSVARAVRGDGTGPPAAQPS